MEQLTSSVWVETQAVGCNFGFATTSDGIVLIDTPHEPCTAMVLSAEIERRGQVRGPYETPARGPGCPPAKSTHFRN